MLDPKTYAIFVILFTLVNIYSLFTSFGINIITLLNIGLLYVSYHLLKTMASQRMYPFNQPWYQKVKGWFRR